MFDDLRRLLAKATPPRSGDRLAGIAADTAEEMKPLADGFIKLIKMTIAPLIFCTVVAGIAGMSSMKDPAFLETAAPHATKVSVGWKATVTATPNSLCTALDPLKTPRVGGTSA